MIGSEMLVYTRPLFFHACRRLHLMLLSANFASHHLVMENSNIQHSAHRHRVQILRKQLQQSESPWCVSQFGEWGWLQVV